MGTHVTTRYFDISSSTLREVTETDYLLGVTGRYAVVSFVIVNGQVEATITTPASHWVHNARMLHKLHEHLMNSTHFDKHGNLSVEAH